MASVLLDQTKAPTYKAGSAPCSGMLFDAQTLLYFLRQSPFIPISESRLIEREPCLRSGFLLGLVQIVVSLHPAKHRVH